ncbi:SitI3 family protein, partial [Paractinoplanes brasiliensis]
GMYVTASADSADDVNEAMKLFGFEDRFWATFRFANLADEATSDHNTTLMVHVLIAFAQTHGGSGVLLHNGERAVLQYGKEGIVFDAGWEDWTENSEIAPLLTQFASRTLPQPLL